LKFINGSHVLHVGLNTLILIPVDVLAMKNKKKKKLEGEDLVYWQIENLL